MAAAAVLLVTAAEQAQDPEVERLEAGTTAALVTAVAAKTAMATAVLVGAWRARARRVCSMRNPPSTQSRRLGPTQCCRSKSGISRVE